MTPLKGPASVAGMGEGLFSGDQANRQEPSGRWFVWNRICVLIVDFGDVPARHQTGEKM
jgi:hypothetical protein